MSMADSTFADKCVTFSSGLISLSLMVYIFAQHHVPVNRSPFLTRANGTVCHCNASLGGDRLEQAKAFEKALEGKNFIQRVHHHITHRKEAVQAAICISAILVATGLVLIYTKMWKHKGHHPTFKRPITYPQGDKNEEILVKDMLKSRARTFVKCFRRWRHLNSQSVGCDQPDGAGEILRMEDFLIRGEGAFTSKQIDIMDSSSGEENDGFGWDVVEIDTFSSREHGHVFAIDAATGEWKLHDHRSLTVPERAETGSAKALLNLGKRIIGKTSKVVPKKVKLSKRFPGSRTPRDHELRASLLGSQLESDSDDAAVR